MDKLKDLLQSRKFWALVIGITTVGEAYFGLHAITAWQAVLAVEAALATFSIATAVASLRDST